MNHIHDALKAAIGHDRFSLVERPAGYFVCVGDEEIALSNYDIPIERPLSYLQEDKIGEINRAFNTAYEALTSDYPDGEKQTWPIQRVEALAWQSDPNSPTPYLDGLALGREIEPEEMRSKTVAQTLLFMEASKPLVSKRQRLRDLVYEATTQQELDTIQWDEPAA